MDRQLGSLARRFLCHVLALSHIQDEVSRW
jgi:hypothetical protein